MSSIPIKPLKKKFNFELSLPGSKSLTNRALIMAALCKEESFLEGLLECDDTQTCREGINNIFPLIGSHSEKKIHCQDAGTVARFFPPICASLGGRYFFDASPRLRERPIKPLIDVLKQQGVQFEFLNQPNQMPFFLESKGLLGSKIFIDTHHSSQFLSGLCIAAPLTKHGMIIQTDKPIAHKPYALMTLELMQKFGVSHHYLDNFTLEILPAEYKATHLTIEPDASTASYFFAAAALTQNTIHIKNLTAESLQGDLKFLDTLAKIGCLIIKNSSGISVTGPKTLQSVGEVNMNDFSDTFMTLAIIAPFLPTPTTIYGIHHTRHQESDRISAIVDGLNRVGIRTENTEDSITIFPGHPQGNTIYSHQDHRIAMAFSILGLKIPGVVINSAECVSKTCPSFFQYLEQLK